jgi:hypothetical protein
MGAREKLPMAFTFDSNGYRGTGQTSSSFLSQHHQLFFINPKITFTFHAP